jgi:predicted RNA-binding protein
LFCEQTFGKIIAVMNVKKTFQTLIVCILTGLVATNVSSFNLHVFHTSLTRIDYNAKQKILEISIQLFTHDLVPLLEKKSGRRIDLEKTPDIDKLIFSYLNENFVLKDDMGETKKIKWVGKELDVDTTRVYVEISTDKSPEGFNLQNTIFFESFPEQTNLVIARFDEKKADLLFKAGDKFKEIKQTVSSKEK